MRAYDEDPGCLEELGEVKPIGIKELIGWLEEVKHSLDLFDKSNLKSGNLVFKTKYTWVEPDQPVAKRNQEIRPLNKKCTLELKIISASFLKDADLIGKQDPYIQFKYGGKSFQTTVKDGAGKFAEWNEVFSLNKLDLE